MGRPYDTLRYPYSVLYRKSYLAPVLDIHVFGLVVLLIVVLKEKPFLGGLVSLSTSSWLAEMVEIGVDRVAVVYSLLGVEMIDRGSECWDLQCHRRHWPTMPRSSHPKGVLLFPPLSNEHWLIFVPVSKVFGEMGVAGMDESLKQALIKGTTYQSMDSAKGSRASVRAKSRAGSVVSASSLRRPSVMLEVPKTSRAPSPVWDWDGKLFNRKQLNVKKGTNNDLFN